MRVQEPGKQPFGLWLPLFLLWPLVLVLAVVSFVVTILVDTVLLMAGQRYHHYTRFLFGCIELLTETRGMTVYVHTTTKTNLDLTVL
jgi:hypothetical protein